MLALRVGMVGVVGCVDVGGAATWDEMRFILVCNRGVSFSEGRRKEPFMNNSVIAISGSCVCDETQKRPSTTPCS